MVSEPREKIFVVWMNSILTNEYVFKELDLNYNPNSILSIQCLKLNTTRADCVMTILGGFMKKVELLVENGNYEVIQYVNYNSYADYQPIRIAFQDKYFACYAFSATSFKYAIMVYNSQNLATTYLHSFIEIPFTINNKVDQLKFGIFTGRNNDSNLFFTTINSNEPLRVYELGNLTLEFTSSIPEYESRSSIAFVVNDGEMEFNLNDLLVKPDKKISSGQIVLIVLVISCFLIFICGFIFIFKSKKSKEETEEELKLAIVEDEKKKKQEEMMMKLTDEQKRVLERQRAFDSERERDMMRDSMDTIAEFEEAVVC